MSKAVPSTVPATPAGVPGGAPVGRLGTVLGSSRRQSTFLLTLCLAATSGTVLLLPSPADASGPLCAAPARDGAGSLTGVVNTYFPATAATAATATTAATLTLGTSAGASTAIAAGDELLVMQVQGATINSTNTSSYGAGDGTGRGASAITAGSYEYVRATSAVSGGVVSVVGSGTNGGLVNAYTFGGANRVEVVRIPQYSSATLTSGLTAQAWNGTTGGVLAIDVEGALALGGATVSVAGDGFRGGESRIESGAGTGTTAANTDYVASATVLANGEKGEGYAGTPLLTGSTTANAYPGGDFARGAPGNAGGGGTDGDPPKNDHNSGGGGGGNGGIGGIGGNSWSSNLADGGVGGAAYAADAGHAVLGGGGGAGTVNNHSTQGAGGAGGGIALIRTGSVTGTGTINASGSAATDDPTNDGGGGGGAGGSVEVTAPSGTSLTGLSVLATGGKGANANLTATPSSSTAHGPGGGGAGGIVETSAAATATTVTGGVNGVTDNAAGQTSYGAGPGGTGVAGTVAAAAVPGVFSGGECSGSLSGHVFEDANADGALDGTDGAVAGGGQTVTLTDGNGNVVATTTADSTGAYSFANVPAGTFTVSVPTPTGEVATTTDPLTVTTTLGESTSGADLGFVTPGSVSGTVFSDVNDNGTQDASETSTVAGSTVSISGGPTGQTLPGSQTVDPTTGGYAFTGLLPGTYTISVTPASGYVVTTGNAAQSAAVTDGASTSAAVVGLNDLTASPLTSSGMGTAVQTVSPTVPTGGTLSLLNGGKTVTTLAVKGQGTYAVSGNQLTFSPVAGFIGQATAASYQVTDTHNQTASSTYTPTVNEPIGPSASPYTSSGSGTTPQTVTVAVPTGDTVTLLDASGNAVTTLTVTGQGTYTLNTSTGVITFTPAAGYTGTATAATYQLTDPYDQTASSTYTPTVRAPAGPTASPYTSSGSGTTPQTVTVAVPTGDTVTLLDGSGNAVSTLTVAGQGTYVLNSSTHAVTFTPVSGYTGTATAATYQLTDPYNQTASSTYTPTVKAPAGPAAKPYTSSGSGTTPQTVTVTVPTGDTVTLLDASGNAVTTLTVSGQGTYTLNTSTGVITFTPAAGYTGTATAATYQLTDPYDQTASSTYTPTVTDPAGPTAKPYTTTGQGTTKQTVTVAVPAGDTIALAGGSDPDTLTIANEGTYVLTPSTDTITFTPVSGYAGTATAATYTITDPYKQTASSTYTPTVTDPTGPTAKPYTSSGVGTTPQTVTVSVPTADTITLLDAGGNPATSVTVANEGTYTLNTTTHVITFTPVGNYYGTATAATFRVTDPYDQTASSTYTPTVAKTTGPTAQPYTSSGVGTATQTVTVSVPSGDTVTLLDAGGKAVSTLTITGEGTYTLDASTGVVTFAPVDGYAGTATAVEYQITDVYGQTASSTYTPTVNDPAAPPTPAYTTTGAAPAQQQVTVAVPNGDTITLLDASGNHTDTVTVAGGTYTLDPSTDVVTFTPASGFVGTADPVMYEITDTYGQRSQNEYTPTVTDPPAPTAKPYTTSGPAPTAQQATVAVPDGDTIALVGGTDADTVVIDGEGIYSLDPTTDVITFTADPGYYGTATEVAYTITDPYGQVASSTYTPTFTEPAGPKAKPYTSSGPGPTAQSVTLTVPTRDRVTLLDADGNRTDTVTVAGEGTYTLDEATRVITFTPVAGYLGTADPTTYEITDPYGQSAESTYTPTFTEPAAPTAKPYTTSEPGGTPQTVTVAVPAGDTVALVGAGGKPTDTVTVTGEGTYVLDPETGVITFTPVAGYLGTATAATYEITDPYQRTATSTDTPTVTKPAGPTAVPYTTSGDSPTPQHVTVPVPTGDTVALVGAGGKTTDTVTVAGEGTYVLDPKTGVITFTPLKGYLGTATPASYQITDPYQQTATSSYTPTFGEPAKPSAGPYTTSGAAPTPQRVTVAVPAGDTVALVGAGGKPTDTVAVAGQGTYVLDPKTGVITFTPVTGYLGTATGASYQITDPYQQTATSTYIPTLTEPAAPDAAAYLSSGVGTAPQHVTVPVPAGDTIALVGAGGKPTDTVTIAGEGTYVLDPATGVITFTPVAGYVGTASPVTYEITDPYGQAGTNIITPTVRKPAPPTAHPLQTTGVGTTPQPVSVVVPAGDSLTLLDSSGQPAKTVVVPGQGTYTVAGDTITFTPVSGFVGQATPVGYRITDGYGGEADSTDTPTVRPVPPPTAAPGAKVGPVDTPISGDLAGTGAGPLTYAVGTRPTHGTVTVDAVTGAYTYVPDPGYTGADTFSYTVTDAAGRVSKSAVVTLTLVPAARPTSTSTLMNTPRHGTVPTPIGTGPFTAVLISQPAHGTVTLQPDGSYVYTPDPGYTGPDSFLYAERDAAGQLSAPAPVSVSVLAVSVTGTSPSGGGGGGTLPFTGAAVNPAVALEVGLVLIAGGVTVRATFRRRRRGA